MSVDQEPIGLLEEPQVTRLPFGDTTVGKLLQVVGVVLILGALCYLMASRNAAPTARREAVVAARELRAYRRLQEGDLAMAYVEGAAEGTLLTDQGPLVGQAVLLRDTGEGEAVTAEGVVVFPPSVVLTGTVLISLPLAEGTTAAALEPGLPVLVVATTLSETVGAPVLAITVPLVDVSEDQAVVAVQPRVAARLSFYLPPWGRVILAPALGR